MTRFQECLEDVLDLEGTEGLTQKQYDAYCSAHGGKLRPVASITKPELGAVYNRVWKEARCEFAPAPLDTLIFLVAIHHGAAKAIKVLQSTLGCVPDGVYGPETVEAMHELVNANGVEPTCYEYISSLEDCYRDMLLMDPTQLIHKRELAERIELLRDFIFQGA